MQIVLCLHRIQLFYQMEVTLMMHQLLKHILMFVTEHNYTEVTTIIAATEHVFSTFASPENLQGKQLQVYNIVQTHYESSNPPPLHIIVSGTAGTGKSYLIHCLRLLLNKQLCVTAPTGVAAFNVEGHTLHSIFALPTRGEFKELAGNHLHQV